MHNAQPTESHDGDAVTLLQNCNALNSNSSNDTASSKSSNSSNSNSSAALHRAHATCLAQLLLLQQSQVEVDSPNPSVMTSLAAAVATISGCTHASADMLIVTACVELLLQYSHGGQLSQAHKLFT
jgi:hypothetical protein